MVKDRSVDVGCQKLCLIVIVRIDRKIVGCEKQKIRSPVTVEER
ncbi:MAG TPA: hypothetical protein QF606_00530 [Anaerolineales bacterium]|uniref:Uncharacterized protein n=1 Tax=marine metagenome TaxID=408172 RepID=A0A383EFG7_9ZZZZ|nr:hypothetical protein [Anaerolineales bacterium]